MDRREKIASISTFIGNTILFFIKITVGIMFNSVAVISDAFNSLMDILTSAVVYYSIKISHKAPDKTHQFGHSRSQPIAGLIIAVLTGVLGFQIFISSIGRFLSNETIVMGKLPMYVMIFVMIVKSTFYLYSNYVYKSTGSVALKAACVDHRNDILISGVVFIGILIANLGYVIFDALAGLVVSLYILYSGFILAFENIHYIMGAAPDEKMFQKIEKAAMLIKGVKGTNDLFAHMLGTEVETEIHIYVDKKLDVEKAHDIGTKVKRKIESIKGVQRAFVHIDPFTGKLQKKRKF